MNFSFREAERMPNVANPICTDGYERFLFSKTCTSTKFLVASRRQARMHEYVYYV